MSVISVMLRKEFRQFFHNAFLPRLCVMFPIMIMLLMPLVANMEVKHVGVVVVDNDHSQLSRRMMSDINASEYLSLYATASGYEDALDMVERGKADVILEIPYGFARSLDVGSPETINISANSVNATKGAMGLQYVQQIVASELARMSVGMPEAKVRFSTLNLFNPTLDYKHFMIPALMIMLIVMLCGFLPALNIVGEKEVGTIEQINVSPISQLTFTLGKILPYWLLGFIVLTISIVIAWLVYGLTPAGSLITIYTATALFIIVMSSMAVVFANFSQNMQQVMFVMFFFVMVFILMSGLMTPVQSMPSWAQAVTYCIPPRYYVDIMRATYLRGASIADQTFSFSMLGLYALLFTAVAIFTYKKQN